MSPSFDQRQQDVFSVNLVVAIALDDLRGALGGFLGSVKPHRRIICAA